MTVPRSLTQKTARISFCCCHFLDLAMYEMKDGEKMDLCNMLRQRDSPFRDSKWNRRVTRFFQDGFVSERTVNNGTDLTSHLSTFWNGNSTNNSKEKIPLVRSYFRRCFLVSFVFVVWFLPFHGAMEKGELTWHATFWLLLSCQLW